MQIKQRSLASIALTITCIGAICVLWLWQQHEQLQLTARQAWQTQLTFAWKQQTAQELYALEQLLAPLPVNHRPSTDHSNTPETQYFSGVLSKQGAYRLIAASTEEKPPIAAQILQDWAQQPLPLRGLFAAGAQNFQWLMMSSENNKWQLAMHPATTALNNLHLHLGGEFSLENPWQTSRSCAATLPKANSQNCEPDQQVITLPVHDIQNQHIAQLVWHPLGFQTYMQALDQQFMRNVWMVGIAGLALITVIFSVLALHLKPIDRSIAALNRLIQGDVHSHIDETHLDAEDEQGAIFHALHSIRNELIQLETLRQERQRLRVQHERLIRSELRKLADSLDSASRDEILQSLAQRNYAAGHDSPQPENTLAELASVLGRMSGLVSTQQSRLLKLLKELQASMQTQAMLASLQQELEIARQMQLSILPRCTPPTRQVHIDALMLPAKEVGGDFYDYFLIDEDHLAVVVADVSGKGVPAAFFMAISRTLLKSNAMHLSSASQTISTLNDQLCAENDQMMFVTVFYAVLELSSGKLRYVNAGHNPPLLKQQTSISYLKSEKNMALAVLEGQDFTAGELTLTPGDSIIFYTDGVTEATDSAQALFGESQLLHAVRQHSPSEAAIPDFLLAQIRAFENGASQADDITIVALEYLGNSKNSDVVNA